MDDYKFKSIEDCEVLLHTTHTSTSCVGTSKTKTDIMLCIKHKHSTTSEYTGEVHVFMSREQAIDLVHELAKQITTKRLAI